MDNSKDITDQQKLSAELPFFNLEKDDLVCLLTDTTKAKKELEAKVHQLEARLKQYDQPDLHELHVPQLLKEDKDVHSHKHDMLSKVTKNCSFCLKLHEPPATILRALFGDHSTSRKLLNQKVLKDVHRFKSEDPNRTDSSSSSNSDLEVKDVNSDSNDDVDENDDLLKEENNIDVLAKATVHWSYALDGGKIGCDLLLNLFVAKKDGDEILVEVSSIDEEDDTDDSVHFLPAIVETARLSLANGVIILRRLPLGQTLFTFTAHVEIRHVTEANKVNPGGVTGDDAEIPSSRSLRRKTTRHQRKTKTNDFAGYEADELFRKLGEKYYNRFKQEKVIDRRTVDDFIQNISNAPPKTAGEHGLIMKSMELLEELSRSKRVPGTVSESVEKFYEKKGEGAGWGVTVAKMDLPAVNLFAEFWLLDTYEKKAEYKHVAIRDVWKNLDGSRSLQCTRSFGLPGGFTDRIFSQWMTWDVLTDKEYGRRTFIIAITPMEEYKGGTRYLVPGEENFKAASSRGIYKIKEVSDNTCEWTWAQQADFRLRSMPKSLLEYLAKQQLGWANEMQEKFRRNGKAVDREKVEALAKVIKERRGAPLMEDQVGVFERCEELFGEGEKEEWRELDPESKNHEVKMHMKYFAPKKGERSVGTGKAVGVVDCSSEEVAAWVVDFCNNDRSRISRDQGNPARLELRAKRRENEGTFATVKKMPFMLDDREFVYRMIWKSEEGKIVVAFEPVDDTVDYGVSLSKTRGTAKGLWVIEDLPSRGGAKQCRATIISQLDVGGVIPTWVMDKKMPASLKVVQDAIDEFRQDEKIDAEPLMQLSQIMQEVWRTEVYTQEENDWLEKVRKYFEMSLEDNSWKKLTSPDPFVEMESQLGLEGTVAGRATTIVNASIFEAAAWERLKLTRKAMKIHYAFGGLDRDLIPRNNHSWLYRTSIDLGISGFAPREWLSWAVWKMIDDKTLLVGGSDREDERFPVGAKSKDGKKYIRASSVFLWKYETLPDLAGIKRTKVTYHQQIDLKGLIPKAIMNSRVVGTLAYLTDFRLNFDKSAEADAGRRAELMKLIADDFNFSHTEECMANFDSLIKEVEGCEPPLNAYGMADESKIHASMFGGQGWGKTKLKIKGTIEEVAAFLWHLDSNANMSRYGTLERPKFEGGQGFVQRQVTRRQRLEGSSAAYHRDRLFESEMTLSWFDDDTLVIMVKTPDERKRGSIAAVNAKETVGILLRRSSDERTTKMEYACKLDLGANADVVQTRNFLLSRLAEVWEVGIFFYRLVPLKDYTLEDGTALGYDLLWKSPNAKNRLARLEEVRRESRGLKELTDKDNLPLVHTMLKAIMEGSLHINRDVKTKLVCLIEKEAMQCGGNLILSLMTELTAEQAVDQWRVQNRAARELMEKCIWFEQTVLVLGKGIVKTAPWGLMARVSIGAIVSVADLFTDLLVLKQFWEGGDEMMGYRNAQLASVCVALFLHLLLVYMTYVKKGAKRVMKESLIVVTGMKAPWDAYKVAAGKEKEKDTYVDPMLELTGSKLAEMFAESIPGILIQTSAILSTSEAGREVTSTAYVSILLSILTTGYVSATLSYDFDTDPQRRAFNPEFYGYVSDSALKRVFTLMSMMIISSSMVLMKSILFISLGRIATMLILVFVVGDMLMYLGYKVARRDFPYWIPGDNLLPSFLFRVVIKIVVDFTGCIQFRHPYDVGGLYFTFNLFVPVIGMSLLLVFIPEGTFDEGTLEILEKATLILGSTTFATLTFFSLLINKEFLKTFLSTDTAQQSVAKIFSEGNDVMKKSVFDLNVHHWEPIKEDVEHWVAMEWHRWEEEKPDWFNDIWKESVPEYMKPERTSMFSSRSSGAYTSQSERRDSPSRRSSRSSRKNNRQGGGLRIGSSRKAGRVVPHVDVKES